MTQFKERKKKKKIVNSFLLFIINSFFHCLADFFLNIDEC